MSSFIHEVEKTEEAQKAAIQQVIDMLQVAATDIGLRTIACVYVDRTGTRYHRFMVCHDDVTAISEGLTDIMRVVTSEENLSG